MNSIPLLVARLLSLLSFIILSSNVLCGQTGAPAVPEDVILRESNYVARISKDAFVITLTRGKETVFQSGGPEDAAMNLDFVQDGKRQSVSKLRSVEKKDDTYVLNYATTDRDADARVELRPEENVLHVKSWILYSASSPVPSAAIKLEPSGQWFGGGFSRLARAADIADQ